MKRALLIAALLAGCTGRTEVQTGGDPGGTSGDSTIDPCVGVICDDGNPCNGLESCDPVLGCVSGPPLSPGTLDPSFGAGGVRVTEVSGGDDHAKGIAIAPSGQLRVRGQGRGTGNDYIAVAYHADGSLDDSFDLDGLHRIDPTNGNDVMRAMAVGPNGEWFLGGSSVDAGNVEASMLVFAADGTPDPIFAGGGVSLITGPEDDVISDAIWLSTGELFVVGTINDSGAGTPAEMFAARILANGTVDGGFGIATTGRSGRELGFAVAVDRTRVYAVGHTWNTSTVSNDIQVVAFNLDDGTVDPTYSAPLVDLGDNEQARDAVLDDDGNLFIAGYSGTAPAGSMVVVKLLPGGLPDQSFGDAGATVLNVTDYGDQAFALVRDAVGRLIMAGGIDDGGANPDAAIVRLSPTGQRDPTFADNGVWQRSFDDTGGVESLRDVTLDAAGRILATGWTEGLADRDLLTVRVCP